MGFNKSYTIEQLPKWLNLIIGLAILWAGYGLIFNESTADSSLSRKTKKGNRVQNSSNEKMGIDMSYFLYGKRSTPINGKSEISKFSISDIDDIELRGTMIADEKNECVAFLHDPHEGSKILMIGDTYLEATLTKIGHQSVTFTKGEETINKKIKIISSGNPYKKRTKKSNRRKKRIKK
jgi:hypothetical protein